eukprot:gene5231-5609_t
MSSQVNSRSTSIKYDLLMNLLLIGDSGASKTCLLQRYSDDSFVSSFTATIGVTFRTKTVQCEGKVIKLHIWDAGGQGTYGAIATSYYRGSKGILLVYDVSDEVSFINVRNWMKQINQNAPPDVNVMLIGNKCDVDPSERKISFEKGKELADDYDIKFLETSAKLNINVNECFLDITKGLLKRLWEIEDRSRETINFMNNQSRRRTYCY